MWHMRSVILVGLQHIRPSDEILPGCEHQGPHFIMTSFTFHSCLNVCHADYHSDNCSILGDNKGEKTEKVKLNAAKCDPNASFIGICASSSSFRENFCQKL